MAKMTLWLKRNWHNRLRAFKRKKVAPADQQYLWPLVGILWIIAISLGYVGFRNYFMVADGSDRGIDFLYRTIQLIVLETNDISGHIPWQLNVARFILPMLAGYTAIQAFLKIFHYQLHIFKTYFMRNHVIICGLGERGLKLTQEFLRQGFQVLVIEQQEFAADLDQAKKEGAIVLVGDATSEEQLIRARVYRAKYLVCVCADDGVNAEIAITACNVVNDYRVNVLHAFIDIFDSDLCNMLSSWSLTTAAECDYFRLEMINAPAKGARLMIGEINQIDQIAGNDQDCDHILVLGLGKMGCSLVVEAAKAKWMTGMRDKSRFRITAIDKIAEERAELIDIQYPWLSSSCTLKPLQIDTESPLFESGAYLFINHGECDINAIYICFDDDVHALTCALKLLRLTSDLQIPILVRMKRDAGLATLVNSQYASPELRRIKIFSLLDNAYCLESFLGGPHEILARAIHERYVISQLEAGETPDTNSSLVGWDDLPETLKESNRHQAIRFEEKLKEIGCTIQLLTDWNAVDFLFTPDEIEIMAEMEHIRWCQERIRQGWSYHKEKKDLRKKYSPYLVEWNYLSEEIKELDRNIIREMPSVLGLAGLQINRKRVSR